MSKQMEKVAELSDFDKEPVKVVEKNDKKYLLVERGDEIIGYRNVCPHQYGPVAEGLIHSGSCDEEMKITCPWHGWEFDIFSGENPIESVDSHLPRIKVDCSDGEVYI